MEQTPGQQSTDYIIRLIKVTPTSQVRTRCAQPLIIIYILCKVLQMVEEGRERRMLGNRMILELMDVPIERIQLVLFHPNTSVEMVASR